MMVETFELIVTNEIVSNPNSWWRNFLRYASKKRPKDTTPGSIVRNILKEDFGARIKRASVEEPETPFKVLFRSDRDRLLFIMKFS